MGLRAVMLSLASYFCWFLLQFVRASYFLLADSLSLLIALLKSVLFDLYLWSVDFPIIIPVSLVIYWLIYEKL